MQIDPNDPRQKQKFLSIVADAGIIASGATAHLNLESLKNEYGNNFNTLILVNNSTEELKITADRRDLAYVNGSGGKLSFDWEFGIIFDDIQITNIDAVNDTSANEIRVSVGRSGKDES